MRSSLRHLLPALLLLSAVSTLSAQIDSIRMPSLWKDRTSTRGLTIGPSVTFGASLTIGAPNSLKVRPRFAYRLMADATYPLTPVIAATFGLGLDSRATEMYQYDEEDFYEIVRVNYFSITPGFSFGAFWLGMNFGVPAGGSRTLAIAGESSEQSFDLDERAGFFAPFERDTTGLAFPLDPLFMVEPRIGARIPLMESPEGWLGLDISFGFTLNEMLERSAEHPGDEEADYHMPSAHLGVFYKFGVPGTERK